MKKIFLLAFLFSGTVASAQLKQFKKPVFRGNDIRNSPLFEKARFPAILNERVRPFVAQTPFIVELPIDRMPCVKVSLATNNTIPNPGKNYFQDNPNKRGIILVK